MIRLNDAVLEEADRRGCPPMESICLVLKMAMWPIFQKEMDAHIDSVKRLADAATGGGFGAMLNKAPKDSAIRQTCEKYAEFFSYNVALSGAGEEAMVFTRYGCDISNIELRKRVLIICGIPNSHSMNRLRNELSRLILAQSGKIKSPTQQAAFLVGIYDDIIRGLTTGPGRTSHPRLQAELSYFRTREEEAKRRM
jgi:hypothetical protein